MQTESEDIREAKRLFPWLAGALITGIQFSVAWYVYSSDQSLGFPWQPYLGFAVLVALVFWMDFLLLKKRQKNL